MRKIILIGTATLVAMASGALLAQVGGTAHDMTTNGNYDNSGNGTEAQVCVYCHTPHKAAGVGGPLWNRKNGIAADGFTTYGATQAGTVANTTVGAQSLACLSCHDGTIATDSIYNAPGKGDVNGSWTSDSDAIPDTSYAYIGQGLKDDHPVSIEYVAGLAGLATVPANGLIGGKMPLYGGQVECASCHSVHDNDLGSFLRVDAAGSDICTACHESR